MRSELVQGVLHVFGGNDLRRRESRVGRPVVVCHVLVTADVLLERLNRKRARETVRGAPDRLHPKWDDLGERIDVLIPRAVEITLEEQVLVAQLLTVALVW